MIFDKEIYCGCGGHLDRYVDMRGNVTYSSELRDPETDEKTTRCPNCDREVVEE